MTFVINACFGGFHLPEEFCARYNVSRYAAIGRDDPRLVNFVLENGGKVEEGYSELVCRTIPDEATDWELNEYDGLESITYVVDGKIYHA